MKQALPLLLLASCFGVFSAVALRENLRSEIETSLKNFAASDSSILNAVANDSASGDQDPSDSLLSTNVAYGVRPLRFYVGCHMVNRKDKVGWCVAQGGNAIESDLRFDSNGVPSEFRHGGVCDCVCSLGVIQSSHVCYGTTCETKESPAQLLNAIAANANMIALFYLDSKLTETTPSVAGANAVKLLISELFSKGFKGQVVIGAGTPETYSKNYLQAAINAANASPEYGARIFFTFDQFSANDLVATWKQAYAANRKWFVGKTNRVAMSNGITVCAPMTFYKAAAQMVKDEDAGVSSLAGIWTLDSSSAMANYIMAGVDLILTNQPSTLRAVAQSLGKIMAVPGGFGLVPAVADKPVMCDCDYHPGGCSLSILPPKGSACKCKYEGAWTCSGSIVPCKQPSSQYCANPASNGQTCRLGGGDCLAYADSCDCSYSPGGCKITKVAPAESACKCSYNFLWTCGGTVVGCNPSTPLCKTPDASASSCALGGGDCLGYPQPTCDCNYVYKGIFTASGCKISKPAPKASACKCSYKGAWTCGGSVVSCSTSNAYCANPDYSKSSCQVGGGDCMGY